MSAHNHLSLFYSHAESSRLSSVAVRQKTLLHQLCLILLGESENKGRRSIKDGGEVELRKKDEKKTLYTLL